MLARRTRSLPLATWRGTPDELKALAASVIEVMDAAKEKAAQGAESKAYAKYSADYAELEQEFTWSEPEPFDDPTADPPPTGASALHQTRRQLLWNRTQQEIHMGRAFAEPTIEFSYTLRNGVQESGRTPDVFSPETLPRQTAGVRMRGDVYPSPRASVEIRLQNAPYSYLGLEVEGEDWLWVSATYARLSEQVSRGESKLIGMLHRPLNLTLLVLAVWVVSSLVLSEILAQLPYAWVQTRPWLGVQLGVLPLLVFFAALGWLYPRFEVLHSVAREQTDATRWLLVALVAAGVLWFGNWLLSLVRR